MHPKTIFEMKEFCFEIRKCMRGFGRKGREGGGGGEILT
jgi:hypothetical protein